MTKRKAQTQPKHPEAATSSVKLSTQPTGLVKKARHQKRLEVVQQTDTSAAEKLLDIDDIFKTARKAIKNATPAAEVPPKSAKRVKGSKDDIFGLGQPAGRRYDPEGLPVYSPEELNVGAGGETDLCPFDCTCCF